MGASRLNPPRNARAAPGPARARPCRRRRVDRLITVASSHCPQGEFALELLLSASEATGPPHWAGLKYLSDTPRNWPGVSPIRRVSHAR